MASKALAISKLVPGVAFVVEGDGTVLWQCDLTQPTEDQIATKLAELTAEEPLKELRRRRTYLLQQCDWTQFPDVPEATRTAWQTYRQQLRDITNTYSSLDDVVWPTKPS